MAVPHDARTGGGLSGGCYAKGSATSRKSNFLKSRSTVYSLPTPCCRRRAARWASGTRLPRTEVGGHRTVDLKEPLLPKRTRTPGRLRLDVAEGIVGREGSGENSRMCSDAEKGNQRGPGEAEQILFQARCFRKRMASGCLGLDVSEA